MGAVLISLSSAISEGAHAQMIDVDLHRVTYNHDRKRFVATGNEIPRGLGLAVRHVWPSGGFVELDVSRGAEDREGAICGGLIINPATQCPPEIVDYAGGVAAAMAGWLGRMPIVSGWSIGARARGGGGVMWVSQAGRSSGKADTERRLTLVGGVSAETSYDVGSSGFSAAASVGVDRIRPRRTAEQCVDCGAWVIESMDQSWIGLGLRWKIR